MDTNDYLDVQGVLFYLVRHGDLINRKRYEVGEITKELRYCDDISENS